MLSYMHAGVRNNAEWCDLVCRSHGLSTRFGAAVWMSERRSPPAYPDAITLVATAGIEEVLSGVDGSAGCSVKDSFASLDLAPAGFRVLFEARWICLPPSPPRGTADGPGPQWRVVRTAGELGAWARAHGGGDVFRPELLTHPMVRVLAAYEGETVVGGAIANRSDDVVGISNVFASGHDLGAIWATAVGAVGDCYPDLTIVGYESGSDLDIARRIGFVETGPLRVWLRD